MICPIDQTQLVLAERQGIEIDYCPQCRGIWLDRGELDKLIERSAGGFNASQRRAEPEHRESHRHDDDDDDDDYYERREHHERHDDHNDHDGKQKRRKKESFLGDIFDF